MRTRSCWRGERGRPTAVRRPGPHGGSGRCDLSQRLGVVRAGDRLDKRANSKPRGSGTFTELLIIDEARPAQDARPGAAARPLRPQPAPAHSHRHARHRETPRPLPPVLQPGRACRLLPDRSQPGNRRSSWPGTGPTSAWTTPTTSPPPRPWPRSPASLAATSASSAGLPQIERILKINQMTTITKEVVDTGPRIPRHRASCD